jgi:uncharacterized protein YndB with AHSA1/START domain
MQPVKLVLHFKSKAVTVFDAWFKPEVVQLWLFKNPVNEIIDVDIDPQIGGRFSILERNERKEYIDHFGKYLVISRPEQLIFSLKAPKHFTGETRVSVRIEEEPGGCILTFTQTGMESGKTQDNWLNMFEQLKLLLRA